MTKSFLTRFALVCVIVVGVVSILATGGGGGDSKTLGPVPPPAGSSNWDELIWDQDQWA